MLEEALTEISLPESYSKFQNYWTHNMGWNWERLEGRLPTAAANQLATTILRLDEEGADGICW